MLDIHATAIIWEGVKLGKSIKVGPYSIIYPGTELADCCTVQSHCVLGLGWETGQPLILGEGSLIRSGSIIYAGVRAGRDFRTGHQVMVLSRTVIGEDVLLGTQTVVDGPAVIGNNVRIQTGVYVTRNTTVGNGVFLGPYVRTTNDKTMKYGEEVELRGPLIGDQARVGSNAVLLPGVKIGEGAVIGAGSVVTRDVPPYQVVAGNPARIINTVTER